MTGTVVATVGVAEAAPAALSAELTETGAVYQVRYHPRQSVHFATD